MIFRNVLICLSFFAMLTVSTAAFAQSKPWSFGWWPQHKIWEDYKRHSPYVEHPRHTQNSQWAGSDWYAEDWLVQKDGLSLIQGFYDADILRDQKVKNDLPVLVVGPAFYRLSGYDRRRVAFMVDQIYGVTKARPNGMYTLIDWHTKVPIGLYTKDGLQLH